MTDKIDAKTIREEFSRHPLQHHMECNSRKRGLCSCSRNTVHKRVADALEKYESLPDWVHEQLSDPRMRSYHELREENERLKAEYEIALKNIEERDKLHERLEQRVKELENGDACPICKQRHWTEGVCGGSFDG